jgi:hypothetical protein
VNVKLAYLPLPELSTHDIERFWRSVDRRGPDECWEWKGDRISGEYGGYGRFWVSPNRYNANRIAYKVATGIDPGQFLIRHTCDNPPCCNPAHLLLGTPKDNIGDAVARGRIARGETGGTAKLTRATVLAMRAMYAAGGLTVEEVGEAHGAAKSAALKAISGQTWAHLPGAVKLTERIGEAHLQSKLTEDQVREIRLLHTRGVTRDALARRFGVGRSTVLRILRREKWKHVE